MPHAIIVDSLSQCIFVRYEGRSSLSEVLGVITFLVEEPVYRQTYLRLHDFSRIDWQPTAKELKRLADHSRMTRSRLTEDERDKRRTAVLVGREVDFGLGRMTQAFADPPGGPTSEFRMCRTYADAAAYLGLPADDYDPFEQPGDAASGN
ncbi:MAG: hypothetical protein AAF458_23010 [Pseudomonadota bacterium]